MSKLIEPRLCGWCHEPFTPTRPVQKYCPRPSICANKAAARHLKGIVPEAALAAKRKRDAELRQGKVSQQFGELSEREQQIYWAGHTAGYDVGYSRGYALVPKKSSAA